MNFGDLRSAIHSKDYARLSKVLFIPGTRESEYYNNMVRDKVRRWKYSRPLFEGSFYSSKPNYLSLLYRWTHIIETERALNTYGVQVFYSSSVISLAKKAMKHPSHEEKLSSAFDLCWHSNTPCDQQPKHAICVALANLRRSRNDYYNRDNFHAGMSWLSRFYIEIEQEEDFKKVEERFLQEYVPDWIEGGDEWLINQI